MCLFLLSMFIGAIGYTYVTGLASVWLMIGWITGDFMASLYVHKRLRKAAERSNASSYAGILSNWWGVDKDSKEHFTTLRRLAAIITLLFLLTYASAQLLAGSKALSVLFEWPLWAGSVTGAVLVSLPTVRVQVDPIQIYAKLDADVRVRLDQELRQLLEENPNLF